MMRTVSARLSAAALLALAACGPAQPPSAPANGSASAPAIRSCSYLVEFVDPATLKTAAPALTVKEALRGSPDTPCPELPAGWRPLASPVGGAAEPAPGSETAARLAKARAGGKKAILTVGLLIE
jgi:hypothetical protein